MLSRIRRSIALKLILASAIPSAVVLLVGLGALIAYTEEVARTDTVLAFRLLEQGAVIGCLLTLTFAGIAVASAIAGGLRGWVIALAAAAIAAWMASMAQAALRRTRR